MVEVRRRYNVGKHCEAPRNAGRFDCYRRAPDGGKTSVQPGRSLHVTCSHRTSNLKCTVATSVWSIRRRPLISRGEYLTLSCSRTNPYQTPPHIRQALASTTFQLKRSTLPLVFERWSPLPLLSPEAFPSTRNRLIHSILWRLVRAGGRCLQLTPRLHRTTTRNLALPKPRR